MGTKIGIIGDMHLCCRDYGSHKDYPKECLEYFANVTKATEKLKLGALIGTGDLTYYKFNDLEFRMKVETELRKQNELTLGNRYEIKGNHDVSTKGMTEYEYYTGSGWLKRSDVLEVGACRIYCVDYGKMDEFKQKVITGEYIIDPDKFNVLVCHDYLRFKDTKMANFGQYIEIDDYVELYNFDLIVCGHIHKRISFTGHIRNGNLAKEVQVIYPGCMCRPAYRADTMDTEGCMVVIDAADTKDKVKVVEHKMKLWAIKDSFLITEEEGKKKGKKDEVAIGDILTDLDSYERDTGSPEALIESMKVPKKYKDKALELLKNGVEGD